MPSLFARKYWRGKPGRTEQVIGACILAIFAIIFSTFLLTSGLFAGIVDRSAFLRTAKGLIGISEQPLFTIDPASLQRPGEARFPEVPGGNVAPPAEIERYTDNLYEKINGKEVVFRAYHVVELRFGRYVSPKEQQTFDVYLYDMKAPANALGIYMAERSAAVEILEIGRDGYLSGASAFFWKGKYYVNVIGPADDSPATSQASKLIAAAIAETITDSGEPFWAEELLPLEDRVPGSFNYLATGALGYEFLDRMFQADYKTGDQTYQMYLLKTHSPEEARELFDKFASAIAKYDKIISREENEGNKTVVSESVGIYTVAFCRSVYFGGVVECEDQVLAVKQAAMLRDRLPR